MIRREETRNMANKRIFRSICTNPWVNLAMDQLLFQHADHPLPVLFLWQNRHTVVIGRNQNAWKECRTELLEAENGTLARRPSGGGALYHDMGNLCFTFACQHSEYDVATHWEIIRRALEAVGIPCQTSGRNDLAVDGRKFSGSAFAFGQGRALHHGTLMVDVDVENMSRYLSVSKEKIASKGVDSVRSRVMNLREAAPGLDMEQLCTAVVTAFADYYQLTSDERTVHQVGEADVRAVPAGEAAYQLYSGWDWRYGASPAGDIALETRFPWGELQVWLTVQEGHVAQAQVYSDALDTDFVDALRNGLTGVQMSRETLVQAAMQIGMQEDRWSEYAADVAGWLQERDL